MSLSNEVERVLIKSNIRPVLLFARGGGGGGCLLSRAEGRGDPLTCGAQGARPTCPVSVVLSFGRAPPGERSRPSERGASLALPCRLQSPVSSREAGHGVSPESGPGHSRPEQSRQGLGPPALAFHQPGIGELLGGKGHGFVLWTQQR